VPLSRIFHKSSLPVALGLVAIGVALLISSTGHSRAKPQAAAQPALPQVEVAEVIHRPLREWQEFSGRLQAPNTVEFVRESAATSTALPSRTVRA